MVTSNTATVGGTILLGNGGRGWEPRTLLLPTPLVLLRFSQGVSRVYASGAAKPFLESQQPPVALLEEILASLRARLPAAGPKAGKPAFPLAVIAAAYEFGRYFPPHENAFSHPGKPGEDEFFASIFVDAFRPDMRGATERIGYAGAIPAGWMPGAPALETSPYGHDAPPIHPHPFPAGITQEPLRPTMDRDVYTSRVQRIKEYLAAGDIYQANLTLPWEGRTSTPPEIIFDVALERGGAAYGAMMLTPWGTTLSFSPELFLRRRGLDIKTRPIKGTRIIPNHMGGLAQATEDLTTSEKDRAEHIMIVDLERNDLGRVCKPGTIRAKPLMKAVEHPTVLHLESTIFGELRPAVTLQEIIGATFPGGSITGAPKKRAIEILGELEIAPRGIYCGAFGWVDADGDFDLNLPIRTATVYTDGRIHLHSGGGIVADSDPDKEWEEMELKTKFFREVMDAANRVT